MVAVRKKVERSDALAQRVVDSASSIVRQLRVVPMPRGITPERLTTLTVIDEDGPIAVSELAKRMDVRSPTMSFMINALVREGFARRRDSKTDGRGVLISLTPQGRRVLRRAQQSSLDRIQQALGNLSEDQVAALTDLALKLKSLSPNSR